MITFDVSVCRPPYVETPYTSMLFLALVAHSLVDFCIGRVVCSFELYKNGKRWFLCRFRWPVPTPTGIVFCTSGIFAMRNKIEPQILKKMPQVDRGRNWDPAAIQKQHAATDEVRHAQMAFFLATPQQPDTTSSAATIYLVPLHCQPAKLPLPTTWPPLESARLKKGASTRPWHPCNWAQVMKDHETQTVTREWQVQLSITLDEARHAGLAWHTLQWICHGHPADRGANQTVHWQVLHRTHIQQRVHEFFATGNDAFYHVWGNAFAWLFAGLATGPMAILSAPTCRRPSPPTL